MRHTRLQVATVAIALAALGMNLPARAGGIGQNPNDPLGQNDPAAQKAKYYQTHYPNENGPYLTKEAAVNEALELLFIYMHWWSDGSSEYGTMIYQDKYGEWWFSTPIQGYATTNGDEVVLDPNTIRRPGCSVAASAHTHPYDPLNLQIFPDPNGDNLTGLPEFVQRYGNTDGTGSDIWYFAPYSHKPKLYGGVRNNGAYPVVVSKYAGNLGALSMGDDMHDLYHAMPGPEGEATLQEALEIGGYVLIGLVLVTGVIFGAGSGGMPFESSGWSCDGVRCSLD